MNLYVARSLYTWKKKKPQNNNKQTCWSRLNIVSLDFIYKYIVDLPLD